MIGVYITSPRTGTTHITTDERIVKGPRRTLCGVNFDDQWEASDETVSGIAADCRTCPTILRSHRWTPTS